MTDPSLAQAPLAVPGGWSGSFGSDVGAGDTLFAVVTGYSNSDVVISSSGPLFDGAAGTGSQAPVKIMEKQYPWDGAATDYVAVWMLPPPAGGWASASGALAVTVTNSAAISPVGLIGYDVAGLGTTPAVDLAPAPAAGNSTAPSSGASGATAQAAEFVVAAIVQDQTQSSLPGGGFTNTQLNVAANSIAGYQITTSAGGSYTYSDTTSPASRWAAGIVTVYAGGGTTHTAAAALTVAPVFQAAMTRTALAGAALTVTPAFRAAMTRTALAGAALTVTPAFRAVLVNTTASAGTVRRGPPDDGHRWRRRLGRWL